MSTGLPERIHRYHILSELGRGSMGRVLLAEDPNIHRKIALKQLLPQQMDDAEEEKEIRQRFLLEAQAAGSLHHPGIVTVFDADIDPQNGNPYLAMEWVQGSSLRTLLRQHGRLPLDAALEIIIQVARALDYAHSHEVVHRDIKPANILISDHGQAKLTDFGIARLVSKSITMTGRVLGTPFYMSPEQIQAQPLDGRSDLFALAAVLYECLTGEAAFGGESLGNVAFRIVTVDPPPVEAHDPDLDPQLSAVLKQALSKDPDERFQSGREFAEALEPFLGTEREVDGEKTISSRQAIIPLLPPANTVTKSKERAPASSEYDFGETEILTSHDDLPVDPESQKLIELLQKPFLLLALSVCLASMASVSALILYQRLSAPETDPTPRLGHAQRPSQVQQAQMRPPDHLTDLDELRPEASRQPAPIDVSSNNEADAANTSSLENSAIRREMGDEHNKDLNLTEQLPSSPERLVSPASEAELPPATLEIMHDLRLNKAAISVWIDGTLAWTRTMERPGGLFRRWFQRMNRINFQGRVEMPAGRREVEVHVSGLSQPFEARETLFVKLESGETQRLRVKLDVAEQKLRLIPKEPEP